MPENPNVKRPHQQGVGHTWPTQRGRRHWGLTEVWGSSPASTRKMNQLAPNAVDHTTTEASEICGLPRNLQVPCGNRRTPCVGQVCPNPPPADLEASCWYTFGIALNPQDQRPPTLPPTPCIPRRDFPRHPRRKSGQQNVRLWSVLVCSGSKSAEQLQRA